MYICIGLCHEEVKTLQQGIQTRENKLDVPASEFLSFGKRGSEKKLKKGGFCRTEAGLHELGKTVPPGFLSLLFIPSHEPVRSKND